MKPNIILAELFDRVSSSSEAIALINAVEINQWPPESVDALKTQKLIKKIQPATSAICPGCERQCTQAVHILPELHPFLVCDKRSDINRIPISSEQLIQWQISAIAITRFIAADLSVQLIGKILKNSDLLEIGMVAGKKRSQMICLQFGEKLVLVVGTNTILLENIIIFDNGRYGLNDELICKLVDSSQTADNRYTPRTKKREEGKKKTQDRHKAWKKEYQKMKKNTPGKTDEEYASQIAKLPISDGRDKKTICKNMKN